MYDDIEMQIYKLYPLKVIVSAAAFVGSILLFLPMFLVIFGDQRQSEAR